ncbi:hypothetical protein ACH5RR_012788 [Cinchona calisaya]|uniref:Aminotransferase-like plant mobile domain-containing protein n=1 Tax=Cinchona calisaya TaxID=153742 RepID=A0ABD3A8U5_9GENT
MAQGNKISLAPAVLGFMYHKLSEIYTNKEGPDTMNAPFPIHLLVGWLREHIQTLYRRRTVWDFFRNYPLLARQSGVLPEKITISHAWLVFRSKQHVEYYSNPLEQLKDTKFLDTDELSLYNFEYLLSLRYTSLPTKAQTRLFCSNTHARFLIPSVDHMDDRTWWSSQVSSNEPVLVIKEIKGIPIGSFKGVLKLADCGNTIDLESPDSVNASKMNNLCKAILYHDGKQVKIKARRLNRVILDSDPRQTVVNWFPERVHQTFDLVEKISSQEKFVEDVDYEDVEILSLKLSNHLKNLQD